MVELVGSIILIVVGVILMAISGAIPPIGNKIAFWIGVLLLVLGIIFLVLNLVGYTALGILPFYNPVDMFIK